MFKDIFGNSPQTKILDFLADHPKYDYSISEIAEKADISKSIQVYRVDISNGNEELVSFAEIQGISTKSFKRLLGTSTKMQVYNTMVQPVNSKLYIVYIGKIKSFVKYF